MNKKLLIGIVVAFIFLVSLGLTYAYFSAGIDIRNQHNEVVTTGTLELTYVDGTQIIVENIEPGWQATKTLTVENTGSFSTYYSINWLSINNTIERNELVMSSTCTGTDCKAMEEEAIGNTPGPFINGIKIEPGVTHTYTFTFEFKETGSEQNYNQGKIFSGVLNVEESSIITTGETLLDKMNIASAQSDASIDFTYTSNGCNTSSTCEANTVVNPNQVTNGLYYTSDLTKNENGERVYYYRGAVENNYVVFAGFCWRIVRTNEDGSIKLRYGGEPTETSGNYTCPQTGTDVGINNQAGVRFNQTYGDNTYVGYMMGLNNIGTSTALNAQANTYDSNIKSVIDDWYENNIAAKGTNVTSKIANTIYCNDRSVGTPGTIGSYTFTSNAYGQNNVLYGAARRLATGGQTGTSYSGANASPQYKCPNVERDGFTLSVANGGTTGYGNNKLTYPIGLLTADEVAYAGGVAWTNNGTYYLYTNEYYWTMSPFSWNSGNANEFRVRSSGGLSNFNVDGSRRAVPAVSLNSEIIVHEGTGEYNSPYEIE